MEPRRSQLSPHHEAEEHGAATHREFGVKRPYEVVRRCFTHGSREELQHPEAAVDGGRNFARAERSVQGEWHVVKDSRRYDMTENRGEITRLRFSR